MFYSDADNLHLKADVHKALLGAADNHTFQYMQVNRRNVSVCFRVSEQPNLSFLKALSGLQHQSVAQLN